MNYSTNSLPNRIAAGFFVLAFCCRPLHAQQALAPQVGGSPGGPSAAAPAARAAVADADVAPAAGDGGVPAEPALALPDPEQLLGQASARLAERRSVAAKVRHRANLYGRELIGSGDYAQGPNSSRLVRYELRMQANQHVVNLLQVCDGRYLWISRLLEHEPEIQRVEVDRVLAAVDNQAAQVGPQAIHQAIAIGGLGQLLNSLQKDFEFHAVAKSQLGDVPVFTTIGRWKPSIREGLPTTTKAPVGLNVELDQTRLRLHVPTHVVVYLGVDDLFPYRLEFRRATGGAEDSLVKTFPASLTDNSSQRLLVLEFFEVQFDIPLEERLFQFAPGSRRYTDVTDLYLQKRSATP